ncbi:MAG: PhoH family protein [Gammaproteobacteria bacterium]|jgi:phosphate starvation-inducible PhoH-like protein
MPVKIVKSLDFDLVPTDNNRLANLCGQFNEHLHQLESYFDVGIACRSSHFQIEGRDENQRAAMAAIKNLYNATDKETLTPSSVQLYLTESSGEDAGDQQRKDEQHRWSMKTSKVMIKGRGRNQVEYLKQIRTFDLTLGVGPAGTGKTYLAVASAVNALENDEVQRLVLVRPAVEAGERLGFLPGDLAQKIDPYLRPMYDALYEMMGFQKVAKLIERNVIEIAPLAYMRGRTLNDSFIILDEAQNTTIDQMKMFLTRIGFGSRAVVTGDVTQVDLPRDKMSGLRHSMHLLRGVEGIGITHFAAADVVRHPLVKKIVDAYDKEDTN